MIFYFISALLMGTALITLGKYAAIITMISTSAKAIVALLLVSALILLYKKFRRTPQLPMLPRVTDK